MAEPSRRIKQALTIVEPRVREFRCPCGRHLTRGTSRDGWQLIKCEGCGKWRRVDFANNVIK